MANIIMPVFTVNSGEVQAGADLTTQSISGGTIEVLQVGEPKTSELDLQELAFLRVTGAKAPKIFGAQLGKEKKNNKVKIYAKVSPGEADFALIIFPTKIGFGGSNDHTGDINPERRFFPFPGEILAKGTIQGAGRSTGTQLIAVMPKNVVFRTHYSGRSRLVSGAYFYIFDGKQIVCLNREEH